MQEAWSHVLGELACSVSLPQHIPFIMTCHITHIWVLTKGRQTLGNMQEHMHESACDSHNF